MTQAFPRKRDGIPIHLNSVQSDSLYWYVSQLKKKRDPTCQILTKLLTPEANTIGFTAQEFVEIRTILQSFRHEYSFLAEIYTDLAKVRIKKNME